MSGKSSPEIIEELWSAVPSTLGDPNANCQICGDERGGSPDHDSFNCKWTAGMNVADCSEWISEERMGVIWDRLVAAYMEEDRKPKSRQRPVHPSTALKPREKVTND